MHGESGFGVGRERRGKPRWRRETTLLGVAVLILAMIVGSHILWNPRAVPAARALKETGTPGSVSQSLLSPTASATAVPPTNSPQPDLGHTPFAVATRSTPTTQRTGTLKPTNTSAPTATAEPTPVDRLTVGGINFVDQDRPLAITYPKDWEGRSVETLDELELLVSDNAGENLRAFSLISQWNGARKVFIYADLLIGSPVLAMHDGYYRNRPLEAEALRRLLEGRIGSPYSLPDIEENLVRIVGERFVFGQDGREATFAVAKAIRMDAQVTQEYSTKPGELSRLLGPIEDPENGILLLICSARQPGEPDEVFPARFLLWLRHTP
ncbi:MAG: hypothetical protein ACYC5M_02950 [Anaerolineae bacterium]